MANEILFREHRWSLDDSMKTVKTIKTVDDIRLYLNDALRWFWKEVWSITFHHTGVDKRIHRDTYNVLITYAWETEQTVAWMTNGIPPEADTIEKK
jgi:hypothetical protein